MLAAKLAFGVLLGVGLCACSDVQFGVRDGRDAGFGGNGGTGAEDGGLEAQAGQAGTAGSPGDARADSPDDAGPLFPRTSVLDRFNRSDGVVGARWVGLTGDFEIRDAAARYTSGSCGPMFWSDPLGAEQEAFMTLSTLDPEANEIFVTLKAQTLEGCDLIEVVYLPAKGTVGVHTCSEGTWTEHEIPAQFSAGDQLGGRALPNGRVEVYKNGTLLHAVQTPEFRYHAQGGRIGIGCWPAEDVLSFDDFGGG
ncbi:MAG TPA: hypothetical protein VI072_10135 [Polyangiaceae bacterium]